MKRTDETAEWQTDTASRMLPSVAATLIAVDAGTTGVTCILFDANLRVLHRAYREFPQHYPRPGWVEHEAREILAAVDATLAEVLARDEASDAAGIGITNQRETVFALDVEAGRALGPGIVWQDRRTAARCEALRSEGREDDIRRRTGLVCDPYFSATKIEWMLAERPEVRRRFDAGVVRFLTVDALVVHHLTGGTVCATDPTNACRTLLYDIGARAWDGGLCDLFGVGVEALPEVRPSSGAFGATDASVVGRTLPVAGVAGDQQAALFGQGCFEEGSFKNTYGTGCFLLLNTGVRRIASEHGLLTTLAADRRGEPCFALEGSVFAGGVVVQWMRDGLDFFRDAADSEAIARTVEDTGGVTLVPAFAGLGAPYWDPDARAAILGITRGTRRAHIVRAGLEAIAWQSAELVECLRAETGLPIDSLLVDGGAAQNDFLMQCQADFAALSVVRPANVETTARGAAALAGLGLGLWSDPGEPAGLRDVSATFEPKLAPADRARRLADWRAAVQRVRVRPS